MIVIGGAMTQRVRAEAGTEQAPWKTLRHSLRRIKAGETLKSPHSAMILFPMGGAIGQHSNGHSAVGNRNANYVFNVTASWEKPEDDAANIEWARASWNDLKRFSTSSKRSR